MNGWHMRLKQLDNVSIKNNQNTKIDGMMEKRRVGGRCEQSLLRFNSSSHLKWKRHYLLIFCELYI